MTNINNINGIGVGLNTNMPAKENAPEVKEEAVQQAAEPKKELNFMSQEDVLNVLAQQAAINRSTINAPKTYDVSKYVTPEQAQRIAGFVTGFEDVVSKNLQSLEAEFGDTMSDAAKMNIVLASADKMAG